MIQWVILLASLAPAAASPRSSSPPRNSMATGRRPLSWWWLGVWGEAESLVLSAFEAKDGAADAHLHRALQACLHGRRREGPRPTARRRPPLSHGSVHSSPPSTTAPPWPRQRARFGAWVAIPVERRRALLLSERQRELLPVPLPLQARAMYSPCLELLLPFLSPPPPTTAGRPWQPRCGSGYCGDIPGHGRWRRGLGC